jgi:Tol biopolymer transport system component
LPDGREFSFETQGGVSRDGRWILGIAREDLTGTERDAYLFDVEHKSYRKFTKLSRSTQAMWLPDSRRILLLRLDNGGLSVLDRATGAIVETGSIGQPLVAAALSGDGRSLISWKEDYEGDIWMLDYGASK